MAALPIASGDPQTVERGRWRTTITPLDQESGRGARSDAPRRFRRRRDLCEEATAMLREARSNVSGRKTVGKKRDNESAGWVKSNEDREMFSQELRISG